MKALSLRTMFALVMMTTVTMISCKKAKEDLLLQAEPVTIEGKWVGKTGTIITPPTAFFAAKISKAGFIEILDKNNAVIGKGLWKLDGAAFSAVYSYEGSVIKYNLAAKYDAANKKLTGSWGDGEVIADNGEFFLDKQ